VVTLVVSVFTQRTKTDEELRGLVYSLTPRIKEDSMPWYKRPVTLAIGILVASAILNVIFW
jgi:SSS family solute:Na+ symporter